MSNNWKWWWMSFADNTGNLGVVIISGKTFEDAHRATHDLGINPGGELCSVEITDEIEDYPIDFRFRLLSRKEAFYLGGWSTKGNKHE